MEDEIGQAHHGVVAESLQRMCLCSRGEIQEGVSLR
jgi:hypothetical protein